MNKNSYFATHIHICSIYVCFIVTQCHFIQHDRLSTLKPDSCMHTLSLHDVLMRRCCSVIVLHFVVDTENVIVLRNWEFLMENCSSNVIIEAACMLRNTSYVTALESTTDFTLSPCRKSISRSEHFDWVYNGGWRKYILGEYINNQ